MISMNPERDHSKTVYLLLLALQASGAFFFVWKELPEFRQLAINPGEQLRYNPYSDFTTIVTVFVMQLAYWYRLLRLPIPFQGSSQILNHILLFAGRLSFIFGGALFSVAFFRHLPEMDQDANVLLMARRGMLLFGAVFALFCFALELERLGHAFGGGQRNLSEPSRTPNDRL
jgi:hypothetical protein